MFEVPLKTSSLIECPNCGHIADEHMPTDACIVFYDCSSCCMILRPRPGDCCVFCSYGSVPCPPVQRERIDQEGRI